MELGAFLLALFGFMFPVQLMASHWEAQCKKLCCGPSNVPILSSAVFELENCV